MLNTLLSSYTFDLLRVTISNDQWSEVTSETNIGSGIKCHFRTKSELVQNGSLGQYEKINSGRIIYSWTPLAVVGDVVVVKMSGVETGRFLVEWVNENRLSSGAIDSYVIFARKLR